MENFWFLDNVSIDWSIIEQDVYRFVLSTKSQAEIKIQRLL